MRELRLIVLGFLTCAAPSVAQWQSGMSIGPALRLGGSDVNPARWGVGANVFATRSLGTHLAWRTDVAMQSFGSGAMIVTTPCQPPPGGLCELRGTSSPTQGLLVGALSTNLVFADTPSSYVLAGAGVATASSTFGLSGARPLATAGFGLRFGRQAAFEMRYQYVRTSSGAFRTLPFLFSYRF